MKRPRGGRVGKIGPNEETKLKQEYIGEQKNRNLLRWRITSIKLHPFYVRVVFWLCLLSDYSIRVCRTTPCSVLNKSLPAAICLNNGTSI